MRALLLLQLAILTPTAPAAEDAAERCLAGACAFLAAHQLPDGSWDDREPTLLEQADIPHASTLLTTSLAIQVQALNGQRESAARGLAWLRKQQLADGSIGGTNSEQAIATRAFLEGWFAGNEACETPARLGLRQLTQRRILPLCWPEQPDERETMDVTASFWCQHVLRIVDQEDPQAMKGRDLVRSAWSSLNHERLATTDGGDGRAVVPTTYPARINVGSTDGFSLDVRAGEALAAGLFLVTLAEGDHYLHDPLRSLTMRLVSDLAVRDGIPPDWRQRFIARTALAAPLYPPAPQPGREQWNRLLIQGFHDSGALSGSWDPHPERPGDGGRITTTCFAALTAWLVRTPVGLTIARVDGALDFLKRAQETDGHWSASTWNTRCPALRTEPAATGPWPSDLATTSLAALGFMGAGYDHKTPNKFRQMVDGALIWVMAQQEADGRWPGTIADHATAVCALAEAYAMTNDPDLKKPVERGIAALLARRKPLAQDGLTAWPKDDASSGFDTWTTLRAVLALRSVRAGGLNGGDGLASASHWWTAALRASAVPPTKEGAAGFPSSLTFAGQLPSGIHADAALSGALAGMFLDQPVDHPAFPMLMRVGFAAQLAAEREKRDDPCARWIATLVLFQRGDLEWRRWAAIHQGPPVPAAARTDNCARGSLAAPEHCDPRPDLLSATLYGLLAEEVFYRYESIVPGQR